MLDSEAGWLAGCLMMLLPSCVGECVKTLFLRYPICQASAITNYQRVLAFAMVNDCERMPRDRTRAHGNSIFMKLFTF